MKKTLKKLAWIVPLWTLPLIASAQGQINTLLGTIRTTLGIIIGILFVLMTLLFIWGIVQYVASGGDEEKLKNGKRLMLWGIIGMAVAAAVWGIVNLLLGYFGLNMTTPIPTVAV